LHSKNIISLSILTILNPIFDPKAFDILEDEITVVIDEEMTLKGTFRDMIYPIYNKHFSEDDLKKMVALNNTEFGKKMIRVMPLITQEGMQAGQSLGPKIQERILARFKNEGIE